MIYAIVIALASLSAAYVAVSWWAMRKISSLGSQVASAMRAEGLAKLEQAALTVRVERAEFERASVDAALSTSRARIQHLEEALRGVLAPPTTSQSGNGMRADDVDARLRQRLERHRAAQAAGTVGGPLPSDGGERPVPGMGTAGGAGAPGVVPGRPL